MANHFFNTQIRNLDETSRTQGLKNNAAAHGVKLPGPSVKPTQSSKPIGVGNAAITPPTPFGKLAKKPANPTMSET